MKLQILGLLFVMIVILNCSVEKDYQVLEDMNNPEKIEDIIEEYNLGEYVMYDSDTDLMWHKGNSNSEISWNDAVGYCDNLNTLEYMGKRLTGWRLPTIFEYTSILDNCTCRLSYSSENIFIEESENFNCAFVECNTCSESSKCGSEFYHEGHFWTSSEYRNPSWWLEETYLPYRWIIEFSYGEFAKGDKDHLSYARCVRGGEKIDIIYNDIPKTITDTDTGLTWQTGRSKKINRYDEILYDEAMDYCNTLELEGYNNWRLPTRDEYRNILGQCNENYEINRCSALVEHLTMCQSCTEGSKCDLFFPGDADIYWTSSLGKMYNTKTEQLEISDFHRWTVHFDNGRFRCSFKNSLSFDNTYARCVRP